MFVVYAMLVYMAGALVVAAFVLRANRQHHGCQQPDEGAGPFGHAVPAGDGAVRLLHSVRLRGRRLRFYRSPLPGADFPWAVLRDLFEIASDGATYDLSAEWVYANNPDLAQVVRTADGPELLLSHAAGVELLSFLAGDAAQRGVLLAEFRERMAEAYVLQSAGLSREEFLALCDQAARRPRRG